MFFQSWWSRTYNRPLKDPLLQDYTLEELVYEYFDRAERELAATESADEERATIEAGNTQEVLDWAEEEEKREEEALRAKVEAARKKAQEEQESDPREDPDNIEWMEQQIAKEKEKGGDDFGDDLSLDFEG